MTTVHRQRQTLRPVTIAITLTSCVLVLAVNWLGVFADIRQAVTVILGAIGVTSAVVAWWMRSSSSPEITPGFRFQRSKQFLDDKRSVQILPVTTSTKTRSDVRPFSYCYLLGRHHPRSSFHPLRGQKFAVMKLSTFRVCRYHWTTRIFKLRHCGYA